MATRLDIATRLDVGNVPANVDEAELRRCFEEHGEVLEVRIVSEGQAWVTMATRTQARLAIEKLQGTRWNAMSLSVTEARLASPSEARSSSKVRMTRQLRERTSVAYELDHSGTPLVIRMFPTDDGAGEAIWRVEVTSIRARHAVISATASTRNAALEEIGRSWRGEERARNLPTLDWSAIIQFMLAIRAS
jgi:hypothetical protein